MKVGFIGLGIMGKPMAKNLLKGGQSVTVFNRSGGAVEELAAAGAEAGKSPRDVALYKKNFESFVNKKGMTIKTKICTIFFFTITMGLGFFMMRKFIVGRILLFIVWISHIIYFIFYIPVYKEDNKKASEDKN